MGSNSLTADQTWAPCIGVRNLGHWTTREVLRTLFSCTELRTHVLLYWVTERTEHFDSALLTRTIRESYPFVSQCLCGLVSLTDCPQGVSSWWPYLPRAEPTERCLPWACPSKPRMHALCYFSPLGPFPSRACQRSPLSGGAWSGRQRHGVETAGWGSDVEQELASDLLPGLCQAVLPEKVPPRLGWPGLTWTGRGLM